MIDAKTFGAIGDGSADDGPALQEAIDAAVRLKQPLSISTGTYNTSQELKMWGDGLRIIGDGATSTIIRAAEEIVSCASLRGTYAHIEGISFDANRKAAHAVRALHLAVSVVRECHFQNARVDGIVLPRYDDDCAFTLNDSNHFDGCSALSNGQVYCTPGLVETYTGRCGKLLPAAGTVSCKKGDVLVTGTGTAFTRMGIRSPHYGDFIRIGTGDDSQFLQIESLVSDTQLKVGVRRTPTKSLERQDFAIAVGNGYTEALGVDNNHNRLSGGLWRSNAGAAMQIGGLYGPLIEHPQIDNIGFYGIVVNFTQGGSQTYNTTILHPYFEGTQASPFLFASAFGISVIQPMVKGSQTVHYTEGPWSAGVWLGLGETADGDDIGRGGASPIGVGSSSVRTSRGLNFANEGKFTHGVKNAGTIDPARTIPILGSVVAVGPEEPVLMTATPTLEDGVDGQEVTIFNQGGGPITFQHRNRLPGSGLRLAEDSVTLTLGSSLRLLWFNKAWCQIGFTHVL